MIQDIEKVAACSILYAEACQEMGETVYSPAVRNFTAGVGRQYIGEIGKTDIIIVNS